MNGETYYATVKGTMLNSFVCILMPDISTALFTAADHVQQTVTAFSNALTVDTTAPTQGQVHIPGGETGYITRHPKGHWTGFKDKESGIASYQWCFGSSPGHDDAITCRQTTDTNFKLNPSLSNRLFPGQPYYVTVKVIEQSLSQ